MRINGVHDRKEVGKGVRGHGRGAEDQAEEPGTSRSARRADYVRSECSPKLEVSQVLENDAHGHLVGDSVSAVSVDPVANDLGLGGCEEGRLVREVDNHEVADDAESHRNRTVDDEHPFDE